MIDFEALVSNLNIPALRQLVHNAWLNILASPLIKVQLWWEERLNGSSYTLFDDVTDYSIYDTVQYGRASYWCFNDPPIGLYPLPTDATYWYKILDDYIGINERSKYSAQKVMLEFAMNRRFSPATITPPFSSSIPSIYIQNNLLNITPILYSAPHGTNTNTWTAPGSSIRQWYSILGNPSTVAVYNYTVFVPSVIFSALDPDPLEAEALIRQEANKYSLVGLKFDIQSY